MSVLAVSPFSLPGLANVYAKITATNIIGESQESPAGNGALMATVSDPPQSLANDASKTSHTQITFKWAAPASNGGSAVIDYKVFWD